MSSPVFPLLITTAIQPPEGIPFLSMTNSIKRKVLSKAALYHWVGKGVTRVVIADATNCLLLSEKELEELALLGVTVEQIQYNQNVERTRAKGKGYAEGKLIEFALENSNLLGDTGHFYKSTGKTFVRNFVSIESIIQKNKIDSLLWRHFEAEGVSRPWADTRFYFTSIDFAVAHLIPSYLESDDKVSACEFHIYNKLNEICQPQKSLRPLVCGFAGGTDSEYFDESLGYLDANFPCWIHNQQHC